MKVKAIAYLKFNTKLNEFNEESIKYKLNIIYDVLSVISILSLN